MNLEDFIYRSNEIHNYKYDYSLSNYNNLKDYIDIICPRHGVFSQRASYHKLGGCPRCQNSKGEDRIEYLLNLLKIKFIRNKKFKSCKNKRVLPFDFYLPDFNLCIEYDGIQHYESIEIFGGDDKLKYQKLLDNIKNEWCINNNIDLLRISYKNYDDIENILRLKIII